MADKYEFSADEEKRMRQARQGQAANSGAGTFVYDDVGARMGQGQMRPLPRQNKSRRVGPFPVTTDTTGTQNYESGPDDK